MIGNLDHLVATVHGIDTTLASYEGALAMQRVTFGSGRVAPQFGVQKINPHRAGRESEPGASEPLDRNRRP